MLVEYIEILDNCKKRYLSIHSKYTAFIPEFTLKDFVFGFN